jgi:hypothetical protein
MPAHNGFLQIYLKLVGFVDMVTENSGPSKGGKLFNQLSNRRPLKNDALHTVISQDIVITA